MAFKLGILSKGYWTSK